MGDSNGYYPATEGDEVEWLSNLGAKCAGYTAALQSTAGEITQVKGTCVLLGYIKGTWLPGLQSQAEAGAAFRDDLQTCKIPGSPAIPASVAFTPPSGSALPATGLLTALFAIIARWKTATTCSEAVMMDLRIKGSAPTPSTNPPEIKAKAEGGQVNVRVIKKNNKGYILQSRRQGDTGWEDLGATTAATFEDKRTVKTLGTAEWREYRAKFWNGKTATGDWSEVVRVTVEG